MIEDCGCAYRDPHEREIGQLSVDWTLAHTTQRSKRFMHELPFDLRFGLGGRQARLMHASPGKVNEYLFEHKPWAHEYSGAKFVNCGAVGKPKDDDPRASSAVLSAPGSGVDVAIERVPYDADAVAAEMRAVGLPDELAEKLPLTA